VTRRAATPARRRLLLALAAVAFLAVAVGGWARHAARPETLPITPSAAGTIAMPNVVRTDVDRTGRQLAAAGLAVRVRRPESRFTPPGASAPLTLPEIAKPFAPGEWTHLVAGQEPPAGTQLAPGAVVTLVVGVHHGAGPFRPWIETHGTAVSVRGEGRCRDCHAQSYCAECHDRWRGR
jgi:hypothetical protein